ncbi:MAG TPA: ArsR family transcriptional regulator [Candidatus Aenigmarchaeota archaeon]|nr:ArsR family transcriptional regulator [Candidatus Aenigmarchaeota archaeon]
MKVHKETPIIQVTLRKFERPYGDFEELLRKFLMSIGLLQPGDSRDDVVKVMRELLRARREKRILQVKDLVKLTDVSPPNARRHLRRLRELGLVERHERGYRLREWMDLPSLVDGVREFVLPPILKRVREYAEAVESTFPEGL